MNKQVIKDMMILTNAFMRIRELHKGEQRFILDKDVLICAECSGLNSVKEPVIDVYYPCPTIQALDGTDGR